MNEQTVSLFRLGSGLNASLNPPSEPKDPCLSVGLGHTLQFILLLDGVTVGRALCSIDKFIGKTLRNRLNVSEGSFPSSSAQQPDRLVNPPKRADIYGLPPHSPRPTDTSGVLPGTGVDDRV